MARTTMPRFTAEASLYRTRTQYRSGSAPDGPLAPREGSVSPAARPIFYRSMKGWCLDLRDYGGSRVCCNGDECGPDVFI